MQDAPPPQATPPPPPKPRASAPGSLRLFQVAGITVFLHWSWFVIAIWQVQRGMAADDGIARYSSILWYAVEYVTLFGIVLLHEFGHVLACRQVGGRADQILLWPLGGIAYVSPPHRPGAHLWSIAAGPLVNVALLPITLAIGYGLRALGIFETAPDLHMFMNAVIAINLGLLVFNLVPVYPLDGGQIVRSLLWFLIGPARSLLVASIIGFAGVALVAYLTFTLRSFLIGLVAFFIFASCWRGLKHALAMARIARLPRHTALACPACGAAPIRAPLWTCQACSTAIDPFETGGRCPNCAAAFSVTRCSDCGHAGPLESWTRA